MPGKGIEILEAVIVGNDISGVNKIPAYVDYDHEEEERKRSLCFVSSRKTTLLLTDTLFILFLYKLFRQCH